MVQTHAIFARHTTGASVLDKLFKDLIMVLGVAFGMRIVLVTINRSLVHNFLKPAGFWVG